MQALIWINGGAGADVGADQPAAPDSLARFRARFRVRRRDYNCAAARMQRTRSGCEQWDDAADRLGRFAHCAVAVRDVRRRAFASLTGGTFVAFVALTLTASPNSRVAWLILH
jgi:hypothetical protein